MKRFCFTAILMVITCNLSAQLFPENFPQSYLKGDRYLYMKGKVENHNPAEPVLNIYVTDYLTPCAQTFFINEDGTFEGKIPITNIQTLHIPFMSRMSVFSFPEDTIYAYYDHNNPENSLKLSGTTKERTAMLELCLLLSRDHLERRLSTVYRMESKLIKTEEESIREELIYSQKYGEIIESANKLIDERVAIVDQFMKETPDIPAGFAEMIRFDIYYQVIDDVPLPSAQIDKIKPPIKYYNRHSYNKSYFLISDLYRKFLYDHLVLDGHSPIDYIITDDRDEIELPISYLKQNFYYALSSIRSVYLRDWFITKVFIRCALGMNKEKVNLIYEEAKRILKTPEFLDVLERTYNEVITLSRGNPAPDFSLRNEKGETVRLSDFEGKAVILSVWDRNCGVCIGEFKNNDDALYKEIKENDIVLIYICCEQDYDLWKKDIKKHNLKGVNLIANHDEDEKLREDYSIYTYPHYVFIDKRGNIFLNDANCRYKPLGEKNNSRLHKLLKTYKYR